ncbi:hypothetical protein PO124_11315 [Bacillus licheniformis]|nr:hypothetical protein [Bacillus licheniformis]
MISLSYRRRQYIELITVFGDGPPRYDNAVLSFKGRPVSDLKAVSFYLLHRSAGADAL